MKEKGNVVLFCTILFCFFVLQWVWPKRVYSENENRYLAQMPTLTWENIWSGKASQAYEDYVIDQFPLRDYFVSVNSHRQIAQGQLLVNNLYVLNNRLVERFMVNDLTLFKRNQQALKDVDLVVIPTSATKVDLGRWAYSQDEEAYLIGNIDIDLTLDDYYRFDHHLNAKGAYKVYEAIAKKKGLQPKSVTYKTLSHTFRGSYYAKSGLFDLPGEDFVVFNEIEQLPVKVWYDQVEATSLVDRDTLQTRDHYTYFLGGNHAEVVIDNLNISDGEQLLVISDSFGHPITSLLTMHYDKVYAIDLRYFKQSLQQYIQAHHIQEIVVIYGVNSLLTDGQIRFLER